jgi:hypothetical protein
MAKQKKSERVRWTWGAEVLRWYRKPEEGHHKDDIIFREKDDFTKREKDTSDYNILKQWKWILKNETSKKGRSKNTIVKRIPALWTSDNVKTKNSLDGRLRALKTLLLQVAEEAGKTEKDLPEDLSWWRAKSKKAKSQTDKQKKRKRLQMLLFPKEKK